MNSFVIFFYRHYDSFSSILNLIGRCGSLESMEVLLQHHANPCLTDSTGRTPLGNSYHVLIIMPSTFLQ